jgi:DNA-binding protein HU-beta
LRALNQAASRGASVQAEVVSDGQQHCALHGCAGVPIIAPDADKEIFCNTPKTLLVRAVLPDGPAPSNRASRRSTAVPAEGTHLIMSKAFISAVLQESATLTGTAANRAAGDLMAAIVKEMKKNGKFTLPSFGTFTVRKTKARKGLNPRTGESIKVKAGKTVRFKASPTLKKSV